VEFFGLLFLAGIALILFLGDQTERGLCKELENELDELSKS